MSFAVPATEQRFLLRHIADLPTLLEEGRHDISADDADAIVEAAADFANGEFAPLLRAGDLEGATFGPDGVHLPPAFRAAYQAYVDNGWGTVGGVAEFGGQALPFPLALAVHDALGMANVGFTLCPVLTQGAIEAIEAHGDEAQKARWLPNLISGAWTGTMNLTEPQAGSDVGALSSQATPYPDGLYKIRGQKIFISFGEHDLVDNIVHLVLARLPDAPPGSKGLSLFLVPRFRLDEEGNPSIPNGAHCVSIEHKLGLKISPTCVMAFGEEEDCFGELLGAPGGGLRVMFTMMNNARLNVGAEGVQIAERAFQQALEYAQERVQSPLADGSSGTKPRPIVQHPDVRRMLSRMAALTQGSRSMIYYTAGLAGRRDTESIARAALLTPLAKAYGSDVGVDVASIGIQVHGGMGYIEETGVAQHLRDARIMPIYEGTNGIQAADLVGRKLKGDNGAALTALLTDISADIDREQPLVDLSNAVRETAAWLLHAEVNDRLSGSYPFLTMLSTLVAGWLLVRQRRIAETLSEGAGWNPEYLTAKIAAANFYVRCIVPEATGLRSSATAGSHVLFA
ncbi:alkylation response protein AidB-like acyl-CoA dehydrogenase [Sphingobium xenophagum]|uniref:Alkylation response protein AidB-like acyl-CoA dehydrogenase n=1 Tax=Sphingobium xenophagum TaxID=121428 RepID=A0ABU1X3M6_SPHXE|nr:acyl-CoA dehydrogenase [Sphingobium xenophagum]MDR7155737.1 alkylation response protein AidB-like acyl-CoA dehydrogenase [Sphingobium xenophagum]